MTEETNRQERPAFRFYGRRKCKTPRPLGVRAREVAAPLLAIMQPSAPLASVSVLFEKEYLQYTLEIGFGMGEHLLARAAAETNTGFMGVEAFQDGVTRVYRECLDTGLENIRIFPDDVRLLWDFLPPVSFDNIYVLFPDPWHKKRHRKRRLIQHKTIMHLATLLRTGGTLHLATDIDNYAEEMQLAAANISCFIQTKESKQNPHQPFEGHTLTKYQRKALQAGRKPVFMAYIKQSDESIFTH